MNTTPVRPAPLALAAALVLVPPLAAQETSEQEGFTLNLDSLVVGFLDTDLDGNSARFEEYRDLDSGFSLPELLVTGSGGGDGRYFQFLATNAGRDDGRYTVGYGVAGRYDLEVDYNKIPHRFGNDGRMIHARTGRDTYSISDATQLQLQRALEQQFATLPSGIGYPFLNNLLAPHIAAADFGR